MLAYWTFKISVLPVISYIAQGTAMAASPQPAEHTGPPQPVCLPICRPL